MILSVLAFAGTQTSAQSAKDAQSAFKASILHQRLYLRNLSGSPIVHAKWIDKSLHLYNPYVRMLGPIRVQSVSFHPNQVEIDGDRFLWNAWPGKVATLGSTSSSARILVDLNGADPMTILPSLRDALFFSSEAEALSAAPTSVGGTAVAKGPTAPAEFRVKTSEPTCDCSERGTSACEGRNPNDGMTQPKVTHQPPDFPEWIHRKGSAEVRLAFDVDTKGETQNLWIIKAEDSATDEAVTAAVLKYKFAPATCHGQPVTVKICIAVNFDTP